MKRSEMVDIISLAFRFSKGGELDKVSGEILDTIEAAGMFPPLKEGQDGYESSEDSYCPASYLEWEPEEIPPCESCERNGQPNCGNSHCVTRQND